MTRHRAHRRRVSRFESLEPRTLMAGDVPVGLDPADLRDLRIDGDWQSNQITVEQVAPDLVQVSGSNGTTINGSTSPVEFTVLDDVRINMGIGYDRVTVHDLELRNRTHSELHVLPDRGNDTLFVTNLETARDARFHGNQGNDYMTVSDVFIGDDIRMFGGEGDDVMLLGYASVNDNVDVYGEDGNDYLRVTYTSTEASINLRGHNGNDYLYLDLSHADDNIRLKGDRGKDRIFAFRSDGYDNIHLHGGSSSDELVAMGLVSEDLRVFAGSGHDTVTLLENSIVDEIFADLGWGNDWLDVNKNSADRPNFYGGSGDDVIYVSHHDTLLHPNTFNAFANSSGFELMVWA